MIAYVLRPSWFCEIWELYVSKITYDHWYSLHASLVKQSLVNYYQQRKIIHHVPKCMSCYKAIVVVTRGTHCFCDCIYITPILLLWDLSTVCVSWMTFDHLNYTACLACWPLFGSLLPEICDLTLCDQVHELPQSHCGDNRKGTLFSWLYIYTPIFILWYLSTLCIVNDLWPLILPSLFSFLSTLWFIGTSNV